MKILTLFMAGMYGWSFLGQWLHSQVNVPAVFQTAATVRELYDVQQREAADYAAFAANRASIDVVRADEARMEALRNAVLDRVGLR